MTTPFVNTVTLNKPLVAAGKIFKGDYSNAQHYITDVQNELKEASVDFTPNKILGIYYDNPQNKKAEELTSFQGVFLQHANLKLPQGFNKIILSGNFLYVKVKGEPMKAIYEGYGALFSYIEKKNVQLKSPAGYQVSTFENGEITTEIYLELA